MRRRILIAMVLATLVAAGCTPPLALQPGARFFALNLPRTTPQADADGVSIAGVYRSTRLLLDDSALAQTHTIVGDVEEGQLLQPGHNLGMEFNAPGTFYGVAVSLSRIGPGPTSARLVLRRGGRQGSVIVARDLTDLPQRGWAELRTSVEPAGQYYIELSNATGEGVTWRGTSLGADKDLWAGYKENGAPFKLPAALADIPTYDGGSVNILVNAQAERIYILGGRSSYDYGVGHWGDYDVRSDGSDRQFIGDHSGELEVVYTDGSRDRVPLVFGLNQWWWKRWGDVPSGGPYLEPFSTTPRPLIASLHVYSLDNNPLAPSYWVYKPQDKKIALLRLIDNPDIQGYPLVSAITLEGKSGGPNTTPLDAPETDARYTDWLAANTITWDGVAAHAYDAAVKALRDYLYTSAADIPAVVALDPITDRSGPRLRFEGSASASILTNVYEHSLRDLRAKLDADGTFHASTRDSASFGMYGGIGTWRGGVGYFYNQPWSRDMGRTLLELTRLGFLDEVDAGLRFAASHLYELRDAYPDVRRRGQQVPPHWGTVLGQPNVIDIDGMGDDNQENDGHGLLLLAFVRAWQARGMDAAWLDGFWTTVRDASEWYCFQLENPEFSRATRVLYTEGEAANDGGYDVYSNVIAAEALRGAAVMATAHGDAVLAGRWNGCAATISRGLAQDLTERDARYGQTWRATAWGWGYGHEALAPAIIAADRTGYTLAAGETLTITRQTYQRQIALPAGLSAGRVLGYGQAFVTQAALLLDDLGNAGKALDTLAQFVYDADAGPYLVPEGVAVHPSGEYWYRTGDLGNAMQEAEVLKTLALVAGVDDLDGAQLRLIPRLPSQWSGVSVADYPVTVRGQRLTVTYTLKRESNGLSMDVTTSRQAPGMSVRLGPLPRGATPLVTVDGAAATYLLSESGGSAWVWLTNSEGHQRIQIDVTW